MSIGRLRIVFTSRGLKHLAPLLDFVEMFIWIIVISEITRGANNIVIYLAYAGGFVIGNYTSMEIENQLAMGMVVVCAVFPEYVSEMTGRHEE